MRPNSQKTADLVKFAGEIHNGKLLFCAVTIINVKTELYISRRIKPLNMYEVEQNIFNEQKTK